MRIKGNRKSGIFKNTVINEIFTERIQKFLLQKF
jgi:hypothetical protein